MLASKNHTGNEPWFGVWDHTGSQDTERDTATHRTEYVLKDLQKYNKRIEEVPYRYYNIGMN